MDSEKTGRFISESRKKCNMTQKELAEKLHITDKAVSKWERGITIPDPSTLLILSKIFDVNINEILLGRRITKKDSKSEIGEKITLNILNDVQNKSKKIKKLKIFIIIFVLLFINIFLIYYFANSYNSIKVFTITGESENFKTSDGILVVTKGKIYFHLGSIINDKNINIRNYELYQIDNNEKQTIYYSDGIDVLLRDYYGYEAYFDIDNLNQVMNNLYLRIYSDDSYEDLLLNFQKDFSNDNFIFKKYAKRSYKIKNNITQDYELTNEEKEFIDKLSCDDEGVCSLDIQDNSHHIFFTYIKYNGLLNILDEFEQKNIEWSYYMKEKLLYYDYYENGKEIEKATIYLDNVDDENYQYYEQLKDNYLTKYLK